MKIEVKHEKCGSELHQTFFEDGKKKWEALEGVYYCKECKVPVTIKIKQKDIKPKSMKERKKKEHKE